MTDFLRPEFASETLPTYQGYHLQIFAAGRAKISLQTESKRKIEFFATRPTRDRDGYDRQKKRSASALPRHFALVDQLLGSIKDARIYRLYKKGNINETADNAHLLVSRNQSALWLAMSGITHRWEIAPFLIHALLEGKGPKSGQASLFNEYMPNYEHDWEDANFTADYYAVGDRSTLDTIVDIPSPSAPSVPPPAKPALTPSSLPETEALDYDEREAPIEDPIFLSDPSEAEIAEPFDILDAPARSATKRLGRSILYSTSDLRDLVMNNARQ